ncbi:Sina domain containing protein [Asbolus verrucosus]|uniref:RING-type E3 ubiquitin transferase n=1 Tax=Asbolus verrucosus TaxID=1661398 RepID=A0A482VMS0_ASBVE|nr:Sina domain containing protein [Asbolus verrucosus]
MSNLGEQSLTQFTDKLLSKKIFTCAVCENLLNIPIILIQNIGNVCNECCQKNNWEGLPNPALEMILNELKIPCKFQITGCKERMIFENLREHENNCKFHEKPCLMAHEGCEWKGIQNNFPGHFIDFHSEHVLTNQYGLFAIDMNIEEAVNITKLLKGKQECIIKIKRDVQDDILLYTICDVKNIECNYECFIKHMGKNGNCVETQCKVSSLNNINTTHVNLTALRQMTEASDVITIQIKICTSCESKEFDEKILHYFECPVCKTLMKPPIYQCKFGHSFCSNCRPKLEKCPNCRALFGTTRNYSLEGLTASISYSCMYHHLGCEETLSVNESDKHEAVCPFKPYPCPLDECSFRGTHSTIGDHLDQQHKDKVIAADFYKTTVEFRLEQMIDFYNYQQKFYMVFDENIFRLSFKRNSDYSFWAVEVLRKKDEDSVFIYDIGIIDMRKPDRKLIRCDLCFTDTNCEDLFKKCILFPNNILASYACNGMFTYYCQIRKRQ